MKRLLVLAIFISLFSATSLAPAAHAEDEKAQKIVVVSISKIVNESKAANSIRKQVKKKREQFQEEVKKKEDKLRAEEQELGKQRTVLAKEAFEEKAKAFRQKVTEVQRDVQKKREQLEKAYGDAMKDVQKAVQEVIEEMAEDDGFVLAIPTSQVLYSSDSLDISDKVLKKLNKKLSDVKVDFEDKE